jgi:hypothetical protein
MATAPWTLGSVSALFVEGYCDQLSYVAGDAVALCVSTSASTYSLALERVGMVRELVHEEHAVDGKQFPVPENAASHGCGWPASHTLTVLDSWRTGVYEITLRCQDGGGTFTHRGKRTAESVLQFVLRSTAPGRDSAILLQLATNSYAAYNNYAGFSVYGYHGINNVQGHRVSFDRPMGTGLFYSWEYFFIVWAERNGIALDFAVNSDLEAPCGPELLSHYKLVVSVGHDEYWSSPMRDSLEAWISTGGNVAFFSGNAVCWQTRTEDDGRALTCWKQWFSMDPAFQVGWVGRIPRSTLVSG